MKVVFLDIDGVLNHRQWYSSKESSFDVEADLNHIDPNSIKLINRLCDFVGAVVVIHSSWVQGHTLETFRRLFKEKGATFVTFDITPVDWNWHGHYMEKVVRIGRWLDEHPEVENYVIIDDHGMGNIRYASDHDHYVMVGNDSGSGVLLPDITKAAYILTNIRYDEKFEYPKER